MNDRHLLQKQTVDAVALERLRLGVKQNSVSVTQNLFITKMSSVLFCLRLGDKDGN